MFEINDDAKGGFRRVEILTGPGRRRKWSAEEKGRIVADTLEPGARVSEVARRWQLCPQQIFGWRREARQEPKALAEEPPSRRYKISFRFSLVNTLSPQRGAWRRSPP